MSTLFNSKGDYLPRYLARRTKSGKAKKGTRVRVTPKYKNGVDVGQEWTQNEVRAIRAMANPKTCTPKAASKLAHASVKRIQLWMRNPYFLNAIHELAMYNLNQYTARVMRATIREACRKSFQDRKLFFQMVGALNPEGKPSPSKGSEESLSPAQRADHEIDAMLNRDVTALEEASRRPPK